MVIDILVLAGICAFFLFHIRYRSKYLAKYSDIEPSKFLTVTTYFMISVTVAIALMVIFVEYSAIYDVFGITFVVGLVVFFVLRRFEINKTYKSIYSDGKFRVN